MDDHYAATHSQIQYLIPIHHPLGPIGMQGFSPGILESSFFLRHIARLPASVENFHEPKPALRARRAAGLDFYDVHFVPVQQLITLRPRARIVLIFSGQSTADAVSTWIESLPSPQPFHVSSVSAPNSLSISRLNRKRLRRHVVRVLEALAGTGDDEARETLEKLNSSPALRRRPLSFPRRDHNTVAPNEIALFSAGMQFLESARLIPSPDDSECIRSIATSASKILSLRSHSALSRAGRTPSLILTTTGQSRDVVKDFLDQKHIKGSAEAQFQVGVRILQKQQGYFHVMDSDVASKFLGDNDVQAAVALRTREHDAQTDALTIRATSELSAVVRLPARANTCHQSMIQLASCFRGGSARRKTKLLQAHQNLTADLRRVVPDELHEVLRSSAGGLRIVSDVLFEWLPGAKDLPLMFERECSRIPTTPGDLLLQQLLPRPPVIVGVGSLQEILVVRSFRKGDKLAELIEMSASTYLQGTDSLRLRFVDCSKASELYDAFNSFNGAVVVFDGHGKRTDKGSALCVGSDSVTGAMLAAFARIPPVVILAACDTHAMDGTPSSVANGILAAGARTVMGSLLPIDGSKSAIFVGRLLAAIVRLVPALLKAQNGFVRWSTLMSRVLRGQLLHESMFPYIEKNPDSVEYLTTMTECIALIASGHPNWFALSLERLSTITKTPLAKYSDLMSIIGGLPDVSAYIQMGDPHSLILAEQNSLAGTPPV